MEYYLGLDSTDGITGGCTTWSFSKIIDQLYSEDSDILFHDYPKLIRLNPNIPFKTRGNGALAAHFVSNLSINRIKDLSVQVLKEDLQYLDRDKKPGLVIGKGNINNNQIYRESLQHLIDISSLDDYLTENMELWPEFNQSHIGAISAIFSTLDEDFSYELLSYRNEQNFGVKRVIDNDNLLELTENYPSTFSSYDFIGKRELIAPSGPDPVFCGIRGENPQDLVRCFKNLEKNEEIVSWMIFKTNQATNAHVQRVQSSLTPYSVISTVATIASNPIEFEGGHVKLGLFINQEFIDCMVFDRSPPLCSCGKRMKNAGKLKGFKCKFCGNKTYFAEKHTISRKLFVGQQVFASLSAQRHLTRPSKRMHVRNRSPLRSLDYQEFRCILTQSSEKKY
jgi:tRNA(Ile2)-agmatinylcytidine synthase